MEFFILFFSVPTLEVVNSDLMDFKKKMKEKGDLIVIGTEQTNYDYLLNSLIEKANKERKGR